MADEVLAQLEPGDARLGKPSARSRSDGAIATGQSLVEGWRAGLSPVNARFVEEMLATSRLDRVCGPEGPPEDAASAFCLVQHE